MRIWSLHPKYLDSKGLVALWRETLLAKNVLGEKTTAYRNHPQLERFKKSGFALDAIHVYLVAVYENSQERGFQFNRDKINWDYKPVTLRVTDKQLDYEMKHLLQKLKRRDPERFQYLSGEAQPEPHPLFNVVRGEIEDWERTGNRT